MRLRPLSEAECYARCYGGHGVDRAIAVRILPRRAESPAARGERVRELFEARLDARGPELEAA